MGPQPKADPLADPLHPSALKDTPETAMSIEGFTPTTSFEKLVSSKPIYDAYDTSKEGLDEEQFIRFYLHGVLGPR